MPAESTPAASNGSRRSALVGGGLSALLLAITLLTSSLPADAASAPPIPTYAPKPTPCVLMCSMPSNS